MTNIISDTQVEDRAYHIAVATALAASKLVLLYWPSKSNAYFDKSLKNELFQKKGAGNYATIADKKSEALITACIRKNDMFKSHGILGEEIEKKKGMGKYIWVIDPIDGTMNFSHGLNDFGINIALMKNYVPIIGVMAFPAYNMLISAHIGTGAYYQRIGEKSKVKIVVNKKAEFKSSLIAYDLGYTERKKQLIQYVSPFADQVEYALCLACVSASVKHMLLGSIGGYFNKKCTLYDIAAPTVIIQEAGGIVSQFNGAEIDFKKNTSSFIASASSSIHARLLKNLKGA